MACEDSNFHVHEWKTLSFLSAEEDICVNFTKWSSVQTFMWQQLLTFQLQLIIKSWVIHVGTVTARTVEEHVWESHQCSLLDDSYVYMLWQSEEKHVKWKNPNPINVSALPQVSVSPHKITGNKIRKKLSVTQMFCHSGFAEPSRLHFSFSFQCSWHSKWISISAKTQVTLTPEGDHMFHLVYAARHWREAEHPQENLWERNNFHAQWHQHYLQGEPLIRDDVMMTTCQGSKMIKLDKCVKWSQKLWSLLILSGITSNGRGH